MHYPIKPVSTSENNPNNKHLTPGSRGKTTVVHSQNADFRFNHAKALLTQ
jgi:hypothetical protein